MPALKKALWTLNINDYEPEITALTYPLLKQYARKIGAEFNVIRERKFPTFPVVYEKLQLFQLGEDYDWSQYVDSDALIHPDMFDLSDHLHKDTVAHNGNDMAGNRWCYDHYFRRDGRHIGSCNWWTIASDWCLDLWHPLDDLTLEQALDNIHLSQAEANSGVFTKEHLIDDYTLSRNIAKYGLKFDTLINLQRRLNDGGNYLWHAYNIPAAQKVEQMKQVLEKWGKLPSSI